MYQLPLRKKKILEKQIGETPLQTIERYRSTHPRYTDVSATYAGRLDPMASGKLLVLFGEECKRKEHYIGLDKQYDIEVLLGVGSDTGDILGITKYGPHSESPTRDLLYQVLRQEVGTHTQSYPGFSSKTVSGKPLFLYALEGTLDTITIPSHEETIYDIKLLDIQRISTHLLETHIRNTLSLAPVSGDESKQLGADFRITDVLESWKRVFTEDTEYTLVKLRVTCGSGAYMRTLAERIGTRLGTRALALSIHRRHIGKRSLWWRL